MEQTAKTQVRALLRRMGLLEPARRGRAWLRFGAMRAVRSVHAPRVPQTEVVRVNLGCGESSGSGYINVDVLPLPNIHYVHDIRTLPMFRDECVDLLYACHVVEHIPRNELKTVFAEWRRILRPGGTFRFSVPDFDALLEVYRKADRDIAVVEAQIMGEKPPHDDHHSIWNETYARRLLTEVGFGNIRRWDPSTASFRDFKDRASASLSVGGQCVPISLNLEASRA